jgi:nitrate reductase cytochrome c-type subunit
MKKLVLLLTTTSLSVLAQSDLLGVHNCYGRGCVACHTPHSGAAGNGRNAGGGNQALWGQNLSPLYGQTIAFGSPNKHAMVTLPANMNDYKSATDPNFTIIACLSCHDGNMARVGLMKGASVETLPVVGGHAPTLLGNDGSGPGNYNNDHPIGPDATFSCGGAKWDCAISSTGQVSMTGPISGQFARNYGFTVALATSGNNVPTVACTTCHDQHSETVWAGKIGGVQASWNTTFFIRGPYTPGASTSGNAASQFCRNCHAEQSNDLFSHWWEEC